SGDAGEGGIGALPAGRLVGEVGLVDRLVFRRQRGLLAAPRRLAGVPLIADAGRPPPLARPVRIFRCIERLRTRGRADRRDEERDGPDRASHGCPPVMSFLDRFELTSSPG